MGRKFELVALNCSVKGNRLLRKEDGLTYDEEVFDGAADLMVDAGFIREVKNIPAPTIESDHTTSIPASLPSEKKGFDDIKVTELKSYLNEVGVAYPSGSDKAYLYDLYLKN